MKKQYKHDDLSTKQCIVCGKRLKKRLEHKDKCYQCYKDSEANRGHFIDRAPRQERIKAGLPVKTY